MVLIKNNQLYFFWKVGKFINEKDFLCENIVFKCSSFLSYYFGNSTVFSMENIIFMRKFYLYFPIYIDKMNNLEWDSYLMLMKIKNRNICYFYYNLSMFCNFDSCQLKNIISSDIYSRI